MIGKKRPVVAPITHDNFTWSQDRLSAMHTPRPFERSYPRPNRITKFLGSVIEYGGNWSIETEDRIASFISHTKTADSPIRHVIGSLTTAMFDKIGDLTAPKPTHSITQPESLASEVISVAHDPYITPKEQ